MLSSLSLLLGRSIIFIVLCAFVCFATIASADTLTLSNEDRLSGEIVKESEEFIHLRHKELGELVIPRSALREEEPEPLAEAQGPQKGDVIQKRRVGAGLQYTEGNTQNGSFHAEIFFDRNRYWTDAWTIKGSLDFETSDGVANGQRAQGSIRYAYSLTPKYYRFLMVSVEHDFFEEIRARIVPTAGMGYWVSERPDFKLLAEVGGGYEKEFNRNDSLDSDSGLLSARSAFEFKVSEHSRIGADVTLLPRVDDFGDYRIEGEGFWRMEIGGRSWIKVSALNDFQSEPAPGVKDNDFRLISQLEHEF